MFLDLLAYRNDLESVMFRFALEMELPPCHRLDYEINVEKEGHESFGMDELFTIGVNRGKTEMMMTFEMLGHDPSENLNRITLRNSCINGLKYIPTYLDRLEIEGVDKINLSDAYIIPVFFTCKGYDNLGEPRTVVESTGNMAWVNNPWIPENEGTTTIGVTYIDNGRTITGTHDVLVYRDTPTPEDSYVLMPYFTQVMNAEQKKYADLLKTVNAMNSALCDIIANMGFGVKPSGLEAIKYDMKPKLVAGQKLDAVIAQYASLTAEQTVELKAAFAAYDLKANGQVAMAEDSSGTTV